MEKNTKLLKKKLNCFQATVIAGVMLKLVVYCFSVGERQYCCGWAGDTVEKPLGYDSQ